MGRKRLKRKRYMNIMHINRGYKTQDGRIFYDVSLNNSQNRKLSLDECVELLDNREWYCDNAIVAHRGTKRYIRGTKGAIKIINITESSYLNIKNIPATKRYIVDIVSHRIKQWEKTKNSLKHVIAICGPRRIGKTTTLKQLAIQFKGEYIDCTGKTGSLDTQINQLIEDGAQYIFIDEACKLRTEAKDKLISLLKNGSEQAFIVFTGSVPKVIEDMGIAIASCEVLNVGGITYTERLVWEHRVDYKNALKVSSHSQMENWLINSTLSSTDTTSYITGIVEDSFESYKGDNYASFKKMILYNDKKLNDKAYIKMIFSYLAMRQMISLNPGDKKIYPLLSNEHSGKSIGGQQEDIKDFINKFKKRTKSEEIHAFCSLLCSAGILDELYDLGIDAVLDNNNEVIGLQLKGLATTSYVFEYPQMINSMWGYNLGVAPLDSWIEGFITLRANQYYGEANKIREKAGDYEIDIIYKMDDFNVNVGALEIKNKPAKNDRITKYIHTANLLNNNPDESRPEVKEVVVTCNDIEFIEVNNPYNLKAYRIRNDIVLILLELAKMYDDMQGGSALKPTIAQLYEQLTNE